MVSGRVCHEVDWIGIFAKNGLLGRSPGPSLIPPKVGHRRDHVVDFLLSWRFLRISEARRSKRVV